MTEQLAAYVVDIPKGEAIEQWRSVEVNRHLELIYRRSFFG